MFNLVKASREEAFSQLMAEDKSVMEAATRRNKRILTPHYKGVLFVDTNDYSKDIEAQVDEKALEILESKGYTFTALKDFGYSATFRCETLEEIVKEPEWTFNGTPVVFDEDIRNALVVYFLLEYGNEDLDKLKEIHKVRPTLAFPEKVNTAITISLTPAQLYPLEEQKQFREANEKALALLGKYFTEKQLSEVFEYGTILQAPKPEALAVAQSVIPMINWFKDNLEYYDKVAENEIQKLSTASGTAGLYDLFLNYRNPLSVLRMKIRAFNEIFRVFKNKFIAEQGNIHGNLRDLGVNLEFIIPGDIVSDATGTRQTGVKVLRGLEDEVSYQFKQELEGDTFYCNNLPYALTTSTSRQGSTRYTLDYLPKNYDKRLLFALVCRDTGDEKLDSLRYDICEEFVASFAKFLGGNFFVDITLVCENTANEFTMSTYNEDGEEIHQVSGATFGELIDPNLAGFAIKAADIGQFVSKYTQYGRTKYGYIEPTTGKGHYVLVNAEGIGRMIAALTRYLKDQSYTSRRGGGSSFTMGELWGKTKVS